jgi:hypothetical protein
MFQIWLELCAHIFRLSLRLQSGTPWCKALSSACASIWQQEFHPCCPRKIFSRTSEVSIHQGHHGKMTYHFPWLSRVSPPFLQWNPKITAPKIDSNIFQLSSLEETTGPALRKVLRPNGRGAGQRANAGSAGNAGNAASAANAASGENTRRGNWFAVGQTLEIWNARIKS